MTNQAIAFTDQKGRGKRDLLLGAVIILHLSSRPAHKPVEQRLLAPEALDVTEKRSVVVARIVDAWENFLGLLADHCGDAEHSGLLQVTFAEVAE